ncbi:MAG TPA: type II toxin-antitoxin system HipA family toxin [Puia sp.]|nr:type II toxin-antitoxin system HipA family toxin [Puia sp.]
MALYLVGENIDKSRGHYQAETGKLIQLMRGIYMDASDDIEAAVLQYAVRISKYLYPRTYLSAASAILLGPTIDGKLFISGPRSQRTRLRNLEIIQNKAPASPSIADAVVNDGISEFNVQVSTIRQRFLEAFRRQSEHSASVDHAMRILMAKRVIEEYGTIEKAADALWAIARQNGWHWEAEQAEQFLKQGIEAKTIKNSTMFNLIVAWHGNPIGTLSHDGFEWRWVPLEGNHLPLIRQTIPGRLPPFISALLPEGWLEKVLKNEDERTLLRTGKRYMSNIVIVDNEDEISKLPVDILETPLKKYSTEGVFTGEYKGPNRGKIEESFERNLAKIYKQSDTPRLSGVQIKAPMYLDKNGVLSPSTGQPFTHILKPAGTGGFEYLPVIEWQSMELGRRIGMIVPDIALIRMPDNMHPALMVERFDIRQSLDDERQIALEDFCSLLDLPAANKYDGTIEQAGRALRAISTEPSKDVLALLNRVLFAWLIADGDMHLKNMAILKITLPGKNTFQSVRMSPLYDAVSTVVFPELKNDLLALKMNGKANRIKRKDFMILATTMGLKASDVDDLINQTATNLRIAVDETALPKGIEYTNAAKAIAVEMLETCKKRLAEFE